MCIIYLQLVEAPTILLNLSRTKRKQRLFRNTETGSTMMLLGTRSCNSHSKKQTEQNHAKSDCKSRRVSFIPDQMDITIMSK